MSIIIRYITPNQAFTFSEGRLTMDTRLDRDDYDKTLSIFNEQLKQESGAHFDRIFH